MSESAETKRTRTQWIFVCAALILAIGAIGTAYFFRTGQLPVSEQQETNAVTIPTAVGESPTRIKPTKVPDVVETGPQIAENSAAPSPPVVEPLPDPATPEVSVPEPPIVPDLTVYECPTGVLTGEIVSANAMVGATNFMILTVEAFVQNSTDNAVTFYRNETPDVIGYDQTGGIQTIQLHGSWHNDARSTFTLQPGESMGYTTTWEVANDNLSKVTSLYAFPEVGGILPTWDDGQASANRCPGPLAPVGLGTDFPFISSSY